MSPEIAWVAVDGATVGREDSCDRILRGLFVALLIYYHRVASILEMPTSQLGLAQEFDEPIVAALVAGSRPQVQKHSVNSVGQTLCVVVSDNNTLHHDEGLQSGAVAEVAAKLRWTTRFQSQTSHTPASFLPL
jgi:hypothetical protein